MSSFVEHENSAIKYKCSFNVDTPIILFPPNELSSQKWMHLKRLFIY